MLLSLVAFLLVVGLEAGWWQLAIHADLNRAFLSFFCRAAVLMLTPGMDIKTRERGKSSRSFSTSAATTAR
jgi:hypothetical protein